MIIKSLIYNLASRFGFKSDYTKLVFKIKKLFGVKFNHQDKFTNFFSTFISEGSLVYDVGANVGKYSNVFLSLGVKVVAIEPNKDLFNILESRFGHLDSFEALNIGLGSRDGFMNFNISDNHLVSTFSEKFIQHKLECGERKN